MIGKELLTSKRFWIKAVGAMATTALVLFGIQIDEQTQSMAVAQANIYGAAAVQVIELLLIAWTKHADEKKKA